MYKPPCALDIPLQLNVALMKSEGYAKAPLRAKAQPELRAGHGAVRGQHGGQAMSSKRRGQDNGG